MNSNKYFKKTGTKFTGTEDEFEILYSDCSRQRPETDKEGYFNKFLCTKDFRDCDFDCRKHHPELNPDIKEFYDSLNLSLNSKT